MAERSLDENRAALRRRIWLAGGVPALGVLAASFLQTEILHGSWDRLNAICSVWNPARSNVNDALPALEAARTLLETPHGPIYDMSQPDRAAFLYPPIAAALYAPHASKGEDALGSLVSFNRLVYLLIGLLVAAALVGARGSAAGATQASEGSAGAGARPPEGTRGSAARRWPTWIEALAVAAAMVLFLPMVRSLELNQASLYVAAFVGAAWVALDRGAERSAGVFLALAAAVKPHLFAVVPLLLFHARRTAAAACVAGLALGAASVLFAGVDNHVTYLTHVLPEAARGYAFFPNQSFGGFFHRLLTDAPLASFELMAPNAAVLRATLAAGAALYGTAFLLLFRARARKDLQREALALAWLITTMIAPIAWGHHYAAALFPLAWLVGRVRDGEERSALRFAGVAIGCALVGSYFVVDGLSGPGARLLASFGLFGALLAAAAIATTLRRSPAAITAAEAAPYGRAPRSCRGADPRAARTPASPSRAPSP
jgi:hypothetical protein